MVVWVHGLSVPTPDVPVEVGFSPPLPGSRTLLGYGLESVPVSKPVGTPPGENLPSPSRNGLSEPESLGLVRTQNPSGSPVPRRPRPNGRSSDPHVRPRRLRNPPKGAPRGPRSASECRERSARARLFGEVYVSAAYYLRIKDGVGKLTGALRRSRGHVGGPVPRPPG